MCGVVALVALAVSGVGTRCDTESGRPAPCHRSHSLTRRPQSPTDVVAPVPLAPERLAGAGWPTCSIPVATASEAELRVGSAPAEAVICLSAGTYGGLELRRARAGNVTLQPMPGQRVTITPGAGHDVAVVFAPEARNIILHGFYITGEIELQPGDASIRVDHNDISGGWFGIQLNSADCTVANAPTWAGCRPAPRITDTVISGNRIHGIVAKGDALNVDNYAGLRVTGNDIYDLVEGGQHTDCLQSTFGGHGVVFDHNYEHDNECQGFFLKDGDVTDATVYDNLFVRDDLPALNGGSASSSSQVYNTSEFVATRNTIWDTKGLTLRCLDSHVPCTATVDHDVLSSLTDGNPDGTQQFRLQESTNVFHDRPWSFKCARSDQVSGTEFVDPSTDDYRLVHDSDRIGIDWAPAGQHYGP